MQSEVFRGFLSSERIYSPAEVNEVLDLVYPYADVVSKKGGSLYDFPVSFDIETTSFTDADGKKAATCYVWMLGIYGLVIVGRTWEEFLGVLGRICDALDVKPENRLVIYVHNLTYEFQFIRRYFQWSEVFALNVRKPIRAVTSRGIEFRCSLLLSGYALEKLGDELQEYTVRKMVGDLDYKKMRNSKTPLTQKELGYCVGDVKVVMAYIAEKIAEDGDISAIPMTKTGYVRRYCRNSCFYGGLRDCGTYRRWEYVRMIAGLTLEPDEYSQLKRAFQGGFTHANPFYSGRELNDVTSYDFTSSYPAVMVAERFPMSRGERVAIHSIEELENNFQLYCCVFDVEVDGLESELWFDSFLSVSRCWNCSDVVTNNGRVVAATHLKTTMTEQDFMVFRKWYSWSRIRISSVIRYKKDYLPTDLIKAILKLYSDKTTLKNVEGKEVEYLRSKEMLNSCYGMMVTDIVRPEIVYDGEWVDPLPKVLEKAIEDYDTDKNRFLFYPWGVWVTSYARRNLFTAILEFAEDYVYSDTDSVKVLNVSKHKTYLDRYNSTVTHLMDKAMDYHGLPRDLTRPRTVKGVEKPLGVWDFDGVYSRFKTLGAKRYMVEYANDVRNGEKKRGTVSLTVSGLNKNKTVPYLLSKGDPFEQFHDEMRIPPGKTGKMTHTYIDELRSGELEDYLGNTSRYSEASAVHLEDVDYSLSLSREYADFIAGIQYIGG